MASGRTDTTRFANLPRQPKDADGPVFAEPWQAQAFALTVHLHESRPLLLERMDGRPRR